MHELDQFRWDHIHENDLFRQVDPEDTELAFHLHNTKEVDQDTLMRVIQSYGSSLYKWIGILLFYQSEAAPEHREILSVLREVFEKAIQNVEQFHGQTSIRDWLFEVSYPVVRGHKHRRYPAGGYREQIIDQDEKVVVHEQLNDHSLMVDRLSEKLRSPLFLKYMFDFGIDEIAPIISLQTKEVHKRLKRARSKILGRFPQLHMGDQIQAFSDGLMNDNPQAVERLQQHIMQCTQCRGYAEKLTKLENELPEELSEQWSFPSLDDGDISELVNTIFNHTQQHVVQKTALLPIRQTAWFAGLAVLFIGLAFIFIKLSPVERKLPQVVLTPTPQLPGVIHMPSARASFQNSTKNISAPQYIDPAFSSDGNWAVFASIRSDPLTRAVILPTIELYNRESNTIQTISKGSTQLRLPWIWWDLAPSISGDGKYIVYVSATNDPDMIGEACTTPDHHACLDIFLYDRDTGETRRLTQSVDGGAADGDSLAPTISEDGNWVAFWSAADNFVDGMKDTCQFAKRTISCMYVYVYNLATGAIEWIPVRNVPGDVVFGVDRISLSADGHLVGFTVTYLAQSRITKLDNTVTADAKVVLNTGSYIRMGVPTILHSSEAVVYNRITGVYELENQAQNGTPGDRASSSPVLSANGRYVAFASASTNLVQGDINQVSDVFLRDRQSGKIELISVNSDGSQGTGKSGLSFWDRGYYSINLSSDGRYVAFESTATNLGQDMTSQCNQQPANECNVLYVHDRQTRITEEISSLPNGDFTFFPAISSDGRWVTFMQSFYNCSTEQFFCSNVMLFDRQSGLVTNLTNNNIELPTLGWNYSGSLTLPWELWESTALAFSPDGTLLALGGYDSKVRIWRIAPGVNPNDKTKPDILVDTGGNDLFTTLAFSREGNWLAAGTTSGDVYFWNMSDGRRIYTLEVLSDPIKKIVFSQDGNHIVISTFTETWILTIGDKVLVKDNVISPGMTAVYFIDISQAGNMLASARGDGTVWIQRLPDGKVLGRLEANIISITDLAFSEDGTLLVTHASNGTVNLWQIGSAETQTADISLINTFQTRGYAGRITFSPDNKYLISTGMVGEITLWSVPDGKLFTISNSVPSGMVHSIAFSKKGDMLAAVFENKIVLWGMPAKLSSCHRTYSFPRIYNNPD